MNTSFLKRPPSGDSSWMYSPVKYRCTSVDLPELRDPTMPSRSSGTVRAIVHSWLFTNESGIEEKKGNQYKKATQTTNTKQFTREVDDRSNRIIKSSLLAGGGGGRTQVFPLCPLNTLVIKVSFNYYNLHKGATKCCSLVGGRRKWPTYKNSVLYIPRIDIHGGMTIVYFGIRRIKESESGVS